MIERGLQKYEHPPVRRTTGGLMMSDLGRRKRLLGLQASLQIP